MDFSNIQDLLGTALSHEVTQFTIAFTIAAWLHSGRVKKEISNQMSAIVASIDSVGSALKQDILMQNARIGNMEDGLKTISSRVENLEKHKGEENGH